MTPATQAQTPKYKVLLLGGTRDAIRLATAIQGMTEVIYSVAGLVRIPELPCEVRSGGFSELVSAPSDNTEPGNTQSESTELNSTDNSLKGLCQYLKAQRIELLINATHPYAATISHNAAIAAQQCGIPCWRYLRPAWQPAADEHWQTVDNWQEAKAAIAAFKKPLIAIGREALADTDNIPTHQHWVIRNAIQPEQQTANYTLLKSIGPFSVEHEQALFEQHTIDVVVCKNSGGDSMAAKLHVAREHKIPVVMIGRPPCSTSENSVVVFNAKQSLLQQLSDTLQNNTTVNPDSNEAQP